MEGAGRPWDGSIPSARDKYVNSFHFQCHFAAVKGSNPKTLALQPPSADRFAPPSGLQGSLVVVDRGGLGGSRAERGDGCGDHGEEEEEEE